MPVSALDTGGEAGTGMDWAGMKGTGLHALYVPQAKTGAVLQRTPLAGCSRHATPSGGVDLDPKELF